MTEKKQVYKLEMYFEMGADELYDFDPANYAGRLFLDDMCVKLSKEHWDGAVLNADEKKVGCFRVSLSEEEIL